MKKWTIEVIEEKDKVIMNRSNDGFNLYELMGFTSLIEKELFSLAKGKDPDEIIRTVRKEKP